MINYHILWICSDSSILSDTMENFTDISAKTEVNAEYKNMNIFHLLPDNFMRSSDAALTDMSCWSTFAGTSCGLGVSSGMLGVDVSGSWLKTKPGLGKVELVFSSSLGSSLTLNLGVKGSF